MPNNTRQNGMMDFHLQVFLILHSNFEIFFCTLQLRECNVCQKNLEVHTEFEIIVDRRIFER